MKTLYARIVDHCSSILEGYGARPVPPADPTALPPVQGQHRVYLACCGHPSDEHGATGECWADDCTCGQPAALEPWRAA